MPYEIEDIRGDLPDAELLANVDRDKQAVDTYRAEKKIDSKWEEAVKLLHGEHLATPIDGRSKLFLRKPKAIIDRVRAGLLDAFFSSPDVAAVEPGREGMLEDVISAKIRQIWLNYRLTKTIPWFNLFYASVDDLGTQNKAILMVDWDKAEEVIRYEEQVPVMNPMMPGMPMMDPETGQPVMQPQQQEIRNVLRDEPLMRLIPPEYMFCDTRVDWTNIYAGQFIIHEDYVTLQDLLMLAESDPLINKEALPDIEAANRTNSGGTSTIQFTRGTETNDQYTDPDRQEVKLWRYFYKVSGKWWEAWTHENRTVIRHPELNHRQHGLPPYVFGYLTPESHLADSDSMLNIARDYFVARNGIRNQRFDNVARVLNKHMIYRRDANVDLASLTNRRPGAATGVDGDPRLAVHWDDPGDITASAYNEEELINRDTEEALGVTDQAQGMQAEGKELATQSVIRQQNVNKKEAVNIRIVAETLVIPAMEMLLALADQYESSQTVMQIIGAGMGITPEVMMQMYGNANDDIPNLFQIKGQYNVRVYAGLGMVTKDAKTQNSVVVMDRLASTFGPLATLPLWRDFLTLMGVKNVQEVLSTIQAILGQQADTQDQQGQNAEREIAAKETAAQGKANGKAERPATDGNVARRMVQRPDIAAGGMM